jgi:PAS domain S-box-containing protein
MFDWRQLRRWNISEDRLPGNSVIRFRELTLWQRYKWYVVGAIGVIVLETLLIGMLLILRRRERQGAAALDKTRQVLRESEERFRNMADTAPVMIVVSDANRKVSFCNKTWLEFTGRTMEQELGQGGTGGMHPADWEDCTAKLRNAYEAGSEYELEYRLLRSDGEYRSVICRGLPRLEPDGTLAGYIESVIDITERKQAEDVHSHLAALVESSNDAIIGTTVHGEITSWNPSAERIYGYKAEEMVGRPLSLLVPPDSPDQIPQIMEHLRHGGRFEQYGRAVVESRSRQMFPRFVIAPARLWALR